MPVVIYTAYVSRSVRGTRIEKGQKLYAIRHDGLYFIWSYSNRDYAERVAKRVGNGPTDAADRAYNWRNDVRQCCPTDRTKD